MCRYFKFINISVVKILDDDFVYDTKFIRGRSSVTKNTRDMNFLIFQIKHTVFLSRFVFLREALYSHKQQRDFFIHSCHAVIPPVTVAHVTSARGE